MRTGYLAGKFFAVLIAILLVQFAMVDQAHSRPKKKYVVLHLGVTRTVKLPTSKGYLVDLSPVSRKHITVFVDEERREIQLTPIKAGTTNLVIRGADKRPLVEFMITIQASNLRKIVREVRDLLSEIDGVEVKIVNRHVVIDGRVILPEQIERIVNVEAQYQGLVTSMVHLSPLAAQKIAQYIERDINSPDISVRAVNDKFILEGIASSEQEKKKAEHLAEVYLPKIYVQRAEAKGKIKAPQTYGILNLIKVRAAGPPPPKKIIKIITNFVELSKDYQKAFKFQWTPELGEKSGITVSSDSSAGVVSTITGVISNLFPKLRMAKAHGRARILQSSSIQVEDGAVGKISNVTRFPFQTLSKNGMFVTASAEEVGLITSITPKIIDPNSNAIQLKVSFRLSSVVSIDSGGAPVSSKKSISTTVSVRSNESAAIGGLVTSNVGTDYNKLPKSTNVDNILISLYASKAFRSEKSQFIVFVTPRIVTTASEGIRRVQEKFGISK